MNRAREGGGAGAGQGGPPGDPADPVGDGGLQGARFDHVAIAVHSFGEMVPLFERLAGVAATEPERVESQGVEVCFVGGVELIRPLGDEGGVARFIGRRGAGLHHIAYRVEDVGAAMRELSAGGRRFTSDGPMTGRGGHRIAFMHPRSAGGVLVELVERG